MIKIRLLSEITQRNMDLLRGINSAFSLKRAGSYNLPNLFGDKFRVALPVPAGLTEFAKLCKSLLEPAGWSIDFSALEASRTETTEYGGKTYTKANVRPLQSLLSSINDSYTTINEKDAPANKVQKSIKTLSALLGAEATSEPIGNKLWHIAYAAIEKLVAVRESNQMDKDGLIQSNLAIVVTRHPVDIVRMSDFPSLESCHSVGGQYWQCAVYEAISYGAVAYIIPSKELEENPLEEYEKTGKEYFRDNDRPRASGNVVPKERVRIRACAHNKTDQLIGVLSHKYYPGTGGNKRSSFTGVDETLRSWLSKKNRPTIDHIREFDEKNISHRTFTVDEDGDEVLDAEQFTVLGGSYIDSPGGAIEKELAACVGDVVGKRLIAAGKANYDADSEEDEIERAFDVEGDVDEEQEMLEAVEAWSESASTLIDELISDFNEAAEMVEISVEVERPERGGEITLSVLTPEALTHNAVLPKGLPYAEYEQFIKQRKSLFEVEEWIDPIIQKATYPGVHSQLLLWQGEPKNGHDVVQLRFSIIADNDLNIQATPFEFNRRSIESRVKVLLGAAIKLEKFLQNNYAPLFEKVINIALPRYTKEPEDVGNEPEQKSLFERFSLKRHIQPGCEPLVVPRKMMLSNKDRKRYKI